MKKRVKKKLLKKRREAWQELIEITMKDHLKWAADQLIEDLKWEARFREAKKRGLPFVECLAFANQKTLTK